MKKRISLLVTCYNEELNIEEIYTRIVNVFTKLVNYQYEIIYIDNVSTDQSTKKYQKLLKKDTNVKLIEMSRNFGSPQPSFIAGLRYASGEAAILLHGDIQDPPELIPQLLKKYEEGYDVVYGVRTDRQGSNFFWKFGYKAFYFILQKIAYISIPLNAGEFSVMSRRVMNSLSLLPEYDYNLRCLRAFVGFKQIGIPYVREARHHGQSNLTLLGAFLTAQEIIFNFSFIPLRVISILGISVTILSLLYVIYMIIHILLYGIPVPGLPSILFVILFLGGIQLLSVSIIAEYIAKIFLEVKKRPRYIIGAVHNMKKENLNNYDKLS